MSRPQRLVAIVDDNADNRELVRVILEGECRVLEYSSGQEALEAMKETQPDVVLLDISLPDLDGIEVLRRIRQQDGLRDLPVIALTAHAMLGDRERLLNFGFDNYLSKPIRDLNQLIELVRTTRRLGAATTKPGNSSA